MRSTGTILTFYSYKGGTGRSMAVANSAWLLASAGRRVLVVDWDLEAPGVHRYFHPFLPDPDLAVSPGIIDLVWKYAESTMNTDVPGTPDWYDALARISPYAMSVEYPFSGAGTIDFVPAGRQDATYSALVSQFDWNNFYDRLGGGGFLEALKRDMRARYDYVLVDSRTGLSDTAGICTVQLPDILVNCFSLSNQAINGAEAVAASVHRQRPDGRLRMFPVPMRVEDGEQNMLDAARDRARELFDKYLTHLDDPERYWGDVEIPYKSFYAYEEILATFGDRPRQENTVLAATERVVGYLTDGRVTELAAIPSEQERRSLLTRFRRKTAVPAELPGPPRAAGPRVFISHASEDSAIAHLLREMLVSRGATVFDWEEQHGSQIVDRIESAIMTADMFIVLMSPAYLKSAWSRQERNLALHREIDTRTQFIRVVKLTDTDPRRAGYLSDYSWLDLTVPREDKLSAVLDGLGIEGSSGSPSLDTPPTFRDRSDELHIILSALTSARGHDFWLITSPPGFGKTWFLQKVRLELNRNTDIDMRLVDIRDLASSTRDDPAALLRVLTGVDDLTIRNIAVSIAHARQPQCWFIDSAELLSEAVISKLSIALAEIHRLVNMTGIANARFAVVVASRHDDWLGTTDPATRFRHLPLGELGVDIVDEALSELPFAVSSERRGEYAIRLHELTEGIPGLLVRGLSWAQETALLDLDRWNEWETLDRVAGSYIRDELMSVDNLLPGDEHSPAIAQRLLRRVLRGLVVYRTVTLSHLRWVVNADPEIEPMRAIAGWTLEDLWSRISRIALFAPEYDLWLVIHPPIRRLLYRYYYPSVSEQRNAHQSARRFYDRFLSRTAGKEAADTLVEFLWHRAMLTLLRRENQDIAASLLQSAAELKKFRSPLYSPTEFSEYLTHRLRQDVEFQRALSAHDGLFDRMTQRIVEHMT